VLATRFTELVGCKVPIQLAGMGAIATPELAAAVSNGGGLGMVGLAMLDAAAVEALIGRIAALTAAPFGVNFLMPFLERDALEVAAARVRVVEFFYGEPERELVEVVHRGGALACWQVGSRQEALAAQRAGCDLVVAQGVEAGGHVRGTLARTLLLEQVVPALRVPVIAAGGIATARDVASALEAGADGVRVGTRFAAAAESGVHPKYRAALVAAKAGDTVLTEAYSVGWPNAPHRVLKSAVAAAEACADEVVGEVGLGGRQLPVARFDVLPPTAATKGRIEAMALYAGESVEAVRGVQPAAQILAELAEGAEALLGGDAPAG
jgi:NAD(P)H-dependent flavin oxidoreductase YrpB (nitropropane dioxygenase family)